MSRSKFDMFKDSRNGEHTRFTAEKLRLTFVVEGGTNKNNRCKCKMLGKFNNACDCVHK